MALTRRSLSSKLPGEAHSRFQAFARIGIAAKGIVYILVGGLALMAAFGEGGQTTDSKGAVAWLAGQPFGRTALFLVAIGLFGYAAWRFVSGFRDTEANGSDAKGIWKRTIHVVIGAVYTGTAVFALRLALGDSHANGQSDHQAQTWTARLLSLPFGALLVCGIGAGIIIAGVLEIRIGWTRRFIRHLRGLPRNHDAILIAGRWGHIARGTVFMAAGALVTKAALQHDPQEARGIDGALDAIANQPWGQWLLAFVAAGLAAYGAWCVIESKYRRV